MPRRGLGGRRPGFGLVMKAHRLFLSIRVQGFGSRVSGSGFRVSVLGFRVKESQGSEFRVRVSGFRVSGFGCRLNHKPLGARESMKKARFGIRDSGFGIRDSGLGLRLIDFVYHSTLGLRVIKKKKKVKVEGVSGLWGERVDGEGCNVLRVQPHVCGGAKSL